MTAKRPSKLSPPTTGFTRYVLYRRPMEETVSLIFVERGKESYRMELEPLRRWLLPRFADDQHFVELLLSHLWNFYHVLVEDGVQRVNTRPLSEAQRLYDMETAPDSMIASMVNRRSMPWQLSY